jgi:sugar phosphate permease
LAVSTALVAVTPERNMVVFAVLVTISGLFCAPTITATVDDLSRCVPASVRGEAIGWHGSALTFGSALGAPLIGTGVDAGGWSWGFALAGAAGLIIAVPGLVLVRRRPASGAGASPASDAVTIP